MNCCINDVHVHHSMWCTCMFSCALLECVYVGMQQDGGCMIGSHCVSNVSRTVENVNIADRLTALQGVCELVCERETFFLISD